LTIFLKFLILSIHRKGGEGAIQFMDQSIQIPADIKQFLESIIDESKIEVLDEHMRQGMVQELYAQLDNYLASIITDQLKGEDLDVFVRMNQERKSKEEIEAYIKEKVPNAQEIFTNAFADFKNLYLESVTAAKANPTQP